MNRKIMIYLVISEVLLGINLFTLLFWLFINPYAGYYALYFCILPMIVIIEFIGWVGVFVVSIVFIAAIATTIIRIYPAALVLSLVAGIATFPLGALGIVAFFLIYRSMKILVCPNCGAALKKDKLVWGLSRCPRCNMTFITRP